MRIVSKYADEINHRGYREMKHDPLPHPATRKMCNGMPGLLNPAIVLAKEIYQ